MPEVKELSKILSEDKEIPTTFSNSDDRDLSEVLKFCSGGNSPERKIRYSDGVERTLEFD